MEPTRSLLLNKGSRVGQERAQGHVCTRCPLAKARVIPGILFQLTHPRAMYFPLKWAALFPEASTALSAGEPAEGVTRRQRSRKGGLRGRVAGDLPPAGERLCLTVPWGPAMWQACHQHPGGDTRSGCICWRTPKPVPESEETTVTDPRTWLMLPDAVRPGPFGRQQACWSEEG